VSDRIGARSSVRRGPPPTIALLLLLIGLIGSVARHAHAEVRVSPPPGWSADAAAPPGARAEARAWADATGLELTQVVAPDENDDFMENLVVLHDRRPLSPAALEGDEQGLTTVNELAGELFDVAGSPTVNEAVSRGQALIRRARWQQRGVTWDMLLVPSGSEHAVVLLKTRTANHSLHGDLIDDIVAGLSGVASPIVEFPRNTWRWVSWLTWLVVGVLAHVGALRWSDRTDDHATASRRAALTLVVLAAAASWLVYAVLDDRVASLTLARTSPFHVALETLLGGITGAGLLVVVGRVLGTGAERVDSAPRTGTFAVDPRPAVRRASAVGPAQPAARSPVPRPLGPNADAELGAASRDENPQL